MPKLTQILFFLIQAMLFGGSVIVKAAESFSNKTFEIGPSAHGVGSDTADQKLSLQDRHTLHRPRIHLLALSILQYVL